MAKEKDRTYPVDFYLKKGEHPEQIKQMMRDLFPGVSHTLIEWAEIDNEINNKRC